jgi:hypothetical protein
MVFHCHSTLHILNDSLDTARVLYIHSSGRSRDVAHGVRRSPSRRAGAMGCKGEAVDADSQTLAFRPVVCYRTVSMRCCGSPLESGWSVGRISCSDYPLSANSIGGTVSVYTFPPIRSLSIITGPVESRSTATNQSDAMYGLIRLRDSLSAGNCLVSHLRVSPGPRASVMRPPAVARQEKRSTRYAHERDLAVCILS